MVTLPNGLDEQTSFVSNYRFESSDPRLTGDVILTSNWLVEVDEGDVLQSSTYELTNDGGSWLGESTAFGSADLDPDHANTGPIIFVGRDGYEGLTAYAINQFDLAGSSEFSGVIFRSAMPEMPEPYAAE